MEPNTAYWNKDRVPKARILFDNIIGRADAIASVAAGDGKIVEKITGDAPDGKLEKLLAPLLG